MLAALYLRGAPRSFELRKAAWVGVQRSLRVRSCGLADAADALRADGFWAEALTLETPGLLSWAEEQCGLGGVLTALDGAYPARWLQVLGASAPPALWISGALPPPPFLAIVGSREISSAVFRFCRECGGAAVKAGYSIGSGGAKGCDRAAVSGIQCSAAVEIVPYGLSLKGCGEDSCKESYSEGICRLSVCAPDEEFTTGSAMERNTLIYALGDAAIIGHARFKTGGTWHGAIEAHRRRLTRLMVRSDSRNVAHRALIALGAVGLRSPGDLVGVLAMATEGVWGNALQPRLSC